MKKELFKKIRRQVNAKKHTTGSIFIAMLVIVVSVSAFLMFVPESVSATSHLDFGNYKKIMIESDYIDASLSNFPILIHDDTGDLQGKVLANGSDIVFYKVGNSTQYYHEIERYNSTSGELWAWVNVTDVSNTVDTVLYMYYGDNNGGYSVGHTPTSVWDTNFLAVYHLNGTEDSTVNNNDLTNDGAAFISEGNIAGCYEFESSPGDVMYQATLLDSWPEEVTWEFLSYMTAASASQIPMSKINAVGHYITLYDTAACYRFVSTKTGGDSFTVGASNGTEYIMTRSEWNYSGLTYKDNDRTRIYGVNSSANTVDLIGVSGVYGVLADGTSKDFGIGAGEGQSKDAPIDGRLDEVRISNIRRSHAWLTASYHNQIETTGFITLGVEDGIVSSSFEIKGLSDNRVTWSGIAGDTVWCNEWLEINMSINSTDTVSEIRVWVGDLNNSGPTAYINASNIELYVSSNNISYATMGSFEDTGNNITLNESQWPGGAGDNPFTLGLTDKNTSIFVRFKLTIPLSSPTDIFYSISPTAWKIHIGI